MCGLGLARCTITAFGATSTHILIVRWELMMALRICCLHFNYCLHSTRQIARASRMASLSP